LDLEGIPADKLDAYLSFANAKLFFGKTELDLTDKNKVEQFNRTNETDTIDIDLVSCLGNPRLSEQCTLYFESDRSFYAYKAMKNNVTKIHIEEINEVLEFKKNLLKTVN
ncbi:MAG: hypothetical protein KDK51_07025, partial [Deltaproteobacteria bacterium]|nr:hypothetical protein [Deltaproteobacteria bacterium]